MIPLGVLEVIIFIFESDLPEDEKQKRIKKIKVAWGVEEE